MEDEPCRRVGPQRSASSQLPVIRAWLLPASDASWFFGRHGAARAHPEFPWVRIAPSSASQREARGLRCRDGSGVEHSQVGVGIPSITAAYGSVANFLRDESRGRSAQDSLLVTLCRSPRSAARLTASMSRAL